MRFYTSDQHFGHRNILHLDPRPWKCIKAHDGALIDAWNSAVTNDDEVWQLGDFSYKCSTAYILSIGPRLNGKVINLLQGNHDGNRQRALAETYPERFRYWGHYHEIKGKGEPHLVLCHYPIESWNRAYHGSGMLHGHSHGTLGPQTWTRIDVGVTCNNWTPVNEADILETFRQRREARRYARG